MPSRVEALIRNFLKTDGEALCLVLGERLYLKRAGARTIVGREPLSEESFRAIADELAPGELVDSLVETGFSLPFSLDDASNPVEIRFGLSGEVPSMTVVRAASTALTGNLREASIGTPVSSGSLDPPGSFAGSGPFDASGATGVPLAAMAAPASKRAAASARGGSAAQASDPSATPRMRESSASSSRSMEESPSALAAPSPPPSAQQAKKAPPQPDRQRTRLNSSHSQI